MELAGDPLTLLHDRELAEPVLEAGVLEGDGRLVGQRCERLHLVRIEPARRRPADGEQPDRLVATPQGCREPDDGL